MSTKKALCVGINEFKNYPEYTLQGCVNDSNDMAALLKNCLGFQSEEITILHNEEATKATIMSELKAMVDGAKERKYSYLVFSMSSHGTQIAKQGIDEKDNADEAFCPYDLAESGADWAKDHIIVDDEFHELFTQLPGNVLLEVFLDTCHSGTGLKVLRRDRKPRYIPPPSNRAPKRIKESFSAKQRKGLEKGLEHQNKDSDSEKPLYRREKGIDKNPDHQILWAACRDLQTSADAHIDSDWHGAFTYYFCKETYGSQNPISRTRLLANVRKSLKDGQYEQTPQLECKAGTRRLSVGKP